MTDPAADNEALFEQQAARESSVWTYPRHLPYAVREAPDVIVTDMDSEEYYDCLAGAGTLALGHNHPRVVEAVERILAGDRPLHTLDITVPVKERFVDTLFDSLSNEFADSARVQFCSPAGTDAVEAALKLVKTATGNRSVLGFQGGYRDTTSGTLSLMSDTDPKENIPGLMPNVHHLPYPYEYRCPFGVGGDECHELAARYVERTLDDPESGIAEPAGMVVEFMQGEGGAILAPDDWTREVRRMTRERDIPLVVDEIQTGLGRTDELYVFEHADIVLDAVTFSKATGGSLPLSVVVYDESLDVWEPGAHAGTFRGDQLTMTAGIATIEHVPEYDLDDHTARMGKRLRGHLDATEHAHDAIGDVRGCGLMLGVELVDPAGESDACGRYPMNPDLAGAVREACFDRGLILELDGRHGSVVRFLPPLVVSPSDVDAIRSIFANTVEAAIEDADADDRREVAAWAAWVMSTVNAATRDRTPRSGS